MERRQDIALGVLFAGLGLAAALVARTYSGATGIYPMVLGLCLALTGGLVAFRGARSSGNEPRPLVEAPANLVKVLVGCMLYVALMVPLGFYTASVLLMVALPSALGFRRLVYTCVLAACFIAMIWLVFTVVLEKPLPAELWSASRLGGE